MTKAQLEIFIYLGLALVTVSVFWPGLGHGFINYDDPDHVTANPQVRAGFPGWKENADPVNPAP